MGLSTFIETLIIIQMKDTSQILLGLKRNLKKYSIMSKQSKFPISFDNQAAQIISKIQVK